MTTQPPSPVAAIDEATFIAELRRLKARSGLSFRQLERRASAAGDTLPYSTAATMLSKNRLPREELLVAFVRACGLDGDEVTRWVTTRATIADGTAAHQATSTPRDSAPASSRWRPVIVAAALVLAFTGGVALTAALESHSIIEEEIVVDTP
jgi:hypothetical protein